MARARRLPAPVQLAVLAVLVPLGSLLAPLALVVMALAELHLALLNRALMRSGTDGKSPSRRTSGIS